MAQKPSIPKGTRDFSAAEVVKRSYIMNTIKRCFSTYGFQPIETPSFENSDTLMGKYGEEGDRLIFKILESGEYYNSVKDKILSLEKFRSEIRFNVKRSYSIVKRFIDNFLTAQEMRLNHKDELNNMIEFEIIPQLGNFKFSSLEDYFKRKRSYIIDKLSDIAFETKSNKTIENGLLNIFIQEIYERTFLTYLNDNKYQVYKSLRDVKSSELSEIISEKALRYDLTVPFARYVVQHQNEITFPFKRYQMQPVWRADRPQKGRFREFYQCDADVVGSKSLWQEVELVQLYDAVFSELNLKGTTIKMNNRKVLSGIAEVIGEEDKLIDFTVALDKLDKIGEEGVKTEMRAKGISEKAIETVQPLFSASGNASEKLELLTNLLAASEVGMKGISELKFIVDAVSELKLKTAELEIDVTLARGLNYYTGAIFEVTAPEGVDMGSIGGGGRYDDLTGIFGMPDVSGVGISFGLDRINLVLEELNLFPETDSANTKVLFINFGESEALYAMKAIGALRNQSIAAELYPDTAKMGKQMGYADKRDIPFAVLAGSSEMEAQSYTLKNMKTGAQQTLNLSDLIAAIQ